MKYTIDEQGIHYVVESEPEPIPDAEAVQIIERIAKQQRAALEQCGCVQQDDPSKCGMCDELAERHNQTV